jgi:SAM-dependent methyltransferase
LQGLTAAKKNSVLDYQYPKILMQFPRLIRVVYVANYFTQLRKWYTMVAWQQLIKELPANAVIIDFGAGEAQYLVPFCKKNPSKTFYALDYRKSNVQFCEALAYSNLKTECVDIEKMTSSVKADLGLCVGVMQYLENDELALRNMHQSLKPGAPLLLYVPINGVLLTGLYANVFKRYAQYESVNQRKRVYTEDEITQKLNNVGFSILRKTYTYGFWGKLSHEWLNTCSTLIFSAEIPLKLIALLVLVLSLPIILVLMCLDFLSKKKDGNGLLVKAEKN